MNGYLTKVTFQTGETFEHEAFAHDDRVAVERAIEQLMLTTGFNDLNIKTITVNRIK